MSNRVCESGGMKVELADGGWLMAGREPAGQGGEVTWVGTFNAQSCVSCKWLRVKSGKASLTFVKPFKLRIFFYTGMGGRPPAPGISWLEKRSQNEAKLERHFGGLRAGCIYERLAFTGNYGVKQGLGCQVAGGGKLQNEATVNRPAFFVSVRGLAGLR